jgi:hypothetical protein
MKRPNEALHVDSLVQALTAESRIGKPANKTNCRSGNLAGAPRRLCLPIATALRALESGKVRSGPA